MRLNRARQIWGGVTTLGLTVGLILAPTAMAGAAAVPGFVAVSIDYAPTAIAVSGLATAPLLVTVHITDGTPLPAEDGYLSFFLQRSSGSGTFTQLAGDARLISGDGSDGVWQASIAVPANAAGTWTLTFIFERGDPGTQHAISAAPALTVTGTHQPRISAGRDPSIVPYGMGSFVTKGRLYDLETGIGFAGVAVKYGLDNQCAEDAGWAATTLTNAAGYFAFPAQTSLAAKVSLNCVVAQTNGVGVAARPLFVRLLSPVSAAPERTTAPVGSIVPVQGRTGAAYCPVELQRLHGATAWRTVGTEKVRSSGRFTVYAQPSVVGANIYRVLVPTCDRWEPASSSRRVITGT